MKWRILLFGLLFSTLINGAAHASESSASAVAKAAPGFEVAADAGTLNLADFKGKVVLLDFWASWCGPCRHSFKWLNEMQALYGKDGFVIVGVNLDEDKAAAQQFLKSNPAEFLIGYDPEGKVAETYGLKGMPSSYLIDRDGRLRLAHVGFRERDKLPMQSEIQSIVSEIAVSSRE